MQKERVVLASKMDFCDFGLKIIAGKNLGWIYMHTIFLILIESLHLVNKLQKCCSYGAGCNK